MKSCASLHYFAPVCRICSGATVALGARHPPLGRDAQVPLAAVSGADTSTFDTKIVSQRQSRAANGGQRRLKKCSCISLSNFGSCFGHPKTSTAIRSQLTLSDVIRSKKIEGGSALERSNRVTSQPESTRANSTTFLQPNQFFTPRCNYVTFVTIQRLRTALSRHPAVTKRKPTETHSDLR